MKLEILLLALLQSEFLVGSAEKVVTFPLLNENSLMAPNTPSNTRSSLRPIDSPATIPAYQGYGAYYVDIFVGSPPQRQTVMVDTGSEKIAVPCTGCKDCGVHIDKHFEQSRSRSFRALTCDQCFSGLCEPEQDVCTVGARYAEGSSWVGYEVQDTVKIKGLHLEESENNENTNGVDLKFTCMASSEGEFIHQKADGIMGMSLRKGSFWNQMYEQGAISSRQFSICLRKFPFVPIGSENDHPAGAITLGGVNDLLHDKEMVYMDINDSDQSALFEVQIRKIYVHPGGGQRLSGNDAVDFDQMQLLTVDMDNMNKGGYAIDSGSTDTILPPEFKPLIDTVWKQVLGFSFPTGPIAITPDELKEWPTFIFQLKGSTIGNSWRYVDEQYRKDVLVVFPPSSYMRLDLTTSMYFPGLWMHNGYDGSILGSNFMRGHNLLFDVENARIGIAESDCDYKYISSGEIDGMFIDPYASVSEIKQLHFQEATKVACAKHRYTCLVIKSISAMTHLVVILLVGLFYVEIRRRRDANGRRSKSTNCKLERKSSCEEFDGTLIQASI